MLLGIRSAVRHRSGLRSRICRAAAIVRRGASSLCACNRLVANLWHGRQTGRVNRDFVEVEVLGAKLKARPGDTTIEPGGQATLMVRPERVRVSMDQPGGDVAAVRAKVVDLTFQGPVLRLSLAAADGSPILAHVGTEQNLPMLRPGDDVFVAWAPDASLVLPAADIPTTEDLEEMLDDS